MERNGTLMPSQRSCNSSTRNQRFMINTTYHRAANEINFIIRAIFFFLYHWQVLTKSHLAKCGMSLRSFTQLIIIPARPSWLQQQFGYNYFSLQSILSMCSDSAMSCLHLIRVWRAFCVTQELLFCHQEYKVSISPLCSALFFLPLFWCRNSW